MQLKIKGNKPDLRFKFPYSIPEQTYEVIQHDSMPVGDKSKRIHGTEEEIVRNCECT